MLEVRSGLLEWAYPIQNGRQSNGEAARDALQRSGGELTPHEIAELKSSSDLWPFLTMAYRELESLSEGEPTDRTPPDRAEAAIPRFRFSESAETILRAAVRLAKRSHRAGMTSNCVLFAFGESAGERTDTARFARDALDRSGGYDDAFKTFLRSSATNATQRAKDAGGWVGPVSASAFRMLESAEKFANGTTDGSREIDQRHLFAALLVSGLAGRPTTAQIQMQRLGLDLVSLRAAFRNFVVSAAPLDNQAAWDDILLEEAATKDSHAPPKGNEFVTGPAGYTSEFCGVGGSHPVADHLGVDEFARRLAELIALRETKLPLAVGLFGNWGSGKSHFMNLIDQHLNALSAQAAAYPPLSGTDTQIAERNGASPWCREIVPIYFNAWHYLDANLWASLVTQIFDGLFKHLQPKADVLALMRSQLIMAGGATARAEDDVAHAKAEVDRTTTALDAARIRSEGARQAVAGLMDNLISLVPRANVEKNRRQIAEWLGVDAEVATLSRLVEKHRDLASLPGGIRELWRRIMAPQGRWWRLGWFVATLVVVPSAVALAGEWFPFFNVVFGPSMRRALSGLATLLAFVAPFAVEVKRRLDLMTRLQEDAEKAQAARPKDEVVIRAQKDFAQAEAAAKNAQAAVEAAKTTERQLAEQVAELRPERRLHRFIESRAQSTDYRGQLGLISLARRDFQELSDVFTDTEALKRKMLTLEPEDAKTMAELSASIDRIVLFIDDLDRCQPEKVVDVLQAVHLLLAYPLFAVVVGVDQRCLRQSLRMQFKGLLTPEQIEDGGGQASSQREEAERPATPLDYLEKIFHVPFHLPAMEEDAYTNLMDKLTEGPKETTADKIVSPPPAAEKQEIGHIVPSVAPSTPLVAIRGEQGPQTGVAIAPGGIIAPPQEPPRPSLAPRRLIGSVPLQPWEVKALKDYHSLIRTPRSAKRLLNTYRLVRAGIPAEEWDAFYGDGEAIGEFRIGMLLLASAAGHPAVAREWFAMLRMAGLAEPIQFHGTNADPAAWLRFKAIYDSTLSGAGLRVTQSLLTKWIGRVEQFAF
jgi:hypothetical protein